MVFSIPPQIIANYPIPDPNNAGSTLSIGTAVKDMPDDSDTPMKIEHNLKVQRAQEKYSIEQTEYDHDFKRLTDIAGIAKASIGEARKKKLYAITALAATIITAVGIILATTLSGALPFAWIAVPFLIGIVPTSYYTHIFRSRVMQLESEIRAPQRLPKPVLALPTYKPSVDPDLRQTRINIQNSLAHKSLSELANAKYSDDFIVSYALLDKVTMIAPEKRPVFYAKCIQLIHAYGKICEERQRCLRMMDDSYHQLTNNLTKWKSDQDKNMRALEYALQHPEQSMTKTTCHMSEEKPHRTVVTSVRVVSPEESRFNLDKQKKEIERTYGAREADLRNWRINTATAINTSFGNAYNTLQQQYDHAKANAA